MSQTVTGVQYPAAIGRIDGHTNYASQSFVVASGVTINAGDFVYFTSGTVTNATVNGARLLGMAEGTATGTATGTVSVSVCIDRNMRYLLKSTTSLALTNGTNSYVGQYFDITGATGAETVSATGTTLGAFVLVQIPGQPGFPTTGLTGLPTGSYGVFVLVNSFLNPYVAS
jgi:hypothetical protein